MTRTNPFRLLLAAAALLASTSVSAAPVFSGQPPPAADDRPPLARPALRIAPLAGATQVVRGSDGRSVVFAAGRLGTLDGGDAAAVMRLLARVGPALGLDRPSHEVQVDDLRADALGMLHAHLVRVESGLRVIDQDLTLHFDSAGTLVSVNGHYFPSLATTLPNARPLPDGALVSKALAAVLPSARARGFRGTKLSGPPGLRSVVWPLPWRAASEVTLALAPHLSWRVYLDAANGEVLAIRSRVRADQATTGSGTDTFGRTRSLNVTYISAQSVYGSIDSSLGTTLLATANAANATDYSGTIFASSTPTFADPACVDAHVNTRAVYDYYRTKHGRNSYDGNGADIVSLVHFGAAYDNAFWNGELMAYGDGDGQSLVHLAACLDVAGHELTHAVVEKTVALVYENQSGALNEHFADVFGTLVEGADWTIGENCVPSGAAPLRDMQTPENGQQPSHMRDFERLPNTEDGDYGGVHVNSGIPNKVAWLIGRDGSLGRDVLGRIWYRILDQRYLNERSDFLDLRRAALRACGDLNLADGCDTVGAAFDAVGLVDITAAAGSCPANSHPEGDGCACDAGWVPNADGTACVEVTGPDCPEHAERVGTDCYCVNGYEPDAAGTSCVSSRTADCPAHSHKDGARCVCDDGWQGSPEAEHGCSEAPVNCPDNARPSASEPGSCECLPGWVPNAAQDGCDPGTDGCGDETFYGRCWGDKLVYCNPNVNHIEVLDCPNSGQVCGLANPTNGNDCIIPPNPCANLTAEGECQGSVARWCQDGEVKTFDCAGNDSDCGLQGGGLGYFCAPCPHNASLHDGPSGQYCACNEGFELDADQHCRAKADGNPGDGHGKSDGGGGGDSDARNAGGCGCGTGPDASMLAFLGLGLVVLRRRRAGLAAAVAAGALAAGCMTPAAAAGPSNEAAAGEPMKGAVLPPNPTKSVPPGAAPVRKLGQKITLQQGESWSGAGGATIVAQEVKQTGEPCPPGVRCIHSGVIKEAVLEVTGGGATRELRLREGAAGEAGGVRITVAEVAPPAVTLLVVRAEE